MNLKAVAIENFVKFQIVDVHLQYANESSTLCWKISYSAKQ